MVFAGSERRPRLADAARIRITVLSQLILGSLVLLGSVLVLLIGEYRYPVAVVLGSVLGFVVLATAVMLPSYRLPRSLIVLLILVDLVMVGLLRIGAPVSGFALLWVIPAIWTAWSFGLAAAVPTALLASGAYLAANLLDPLQRPNLSLLLFPLFLAGMTAIAYLMARRSDAQRELLERQSFVLQGIAERARYQQELVTDVLAAVDFGVVRIDPDGEVVFANEAFGRMQRLHERSGGVTHAADGSTPVPADGLPVERAQRGEVFDSELVWLGDADAERRAIRSSARRIRNVRGEPEGTIVVIEDVTAEQLALRAREDLIASVSHELRTPLTSILGYLELVLEDDSLTPTIARQLAAAERGAERLLSLVTDILTTAEASRGGVVPTLDRGLVELAEILRAAIADAEPRATARRMTVDSTGIESAPAWVDAQRIRQVVDNLIANAIKYADEGGRVEIGCTTDGQQSLIVVRDDGPGISADEQPRLFEPYFRSAVARRSAVHGNGLGLAISRDIVRAHGGDITVRSVLGEGAAFLVRLPATIPKGDDR
ncbi:MAG: HAMP domain-containing sensor histidine kinase [Propionicimonas sp.]